MSPGALARGGSNNAKLSIMANTPMDERKQINFTIVPDDKDETPRIYANFCAISHTPFDFTLSFCEVLPLSESDIQQAQANHVVRAPVRAKMPAIWCRRHSSAPRGTSRRCRPEPDRKKRGLSAC